ncbi:hypothetical protein HWV62_26586 [Athelia sp. TMB]|nr:hypothetical protein HWV62_26586 [Athelia sp. TMB]
MDKLLDGVPTTRAVQASLGVCFAGFVVCVGLWGVSLAQTAFYLYHFPRDGRFRKIMVLSMSIVDCVHVAFIASLFWDMLIYNRFNHVDARVAIGHPWSAVPRANPFLFSLAARSQADMLIAQSIMEMTTQGVWRVSRGNRALVIIIITCMLAAPVALLVGLFHGPFPELPMTTIVPLNLIPLLIVDGTIYGALVYYFNASRLGMPRYFLPPPPLPSPSSVVRADGFVVVAGRTEPVLRQLIWLSVNSGLLLWCVFPAMRGREANVSSARRLFTALSFYMYERDTADPASILAPTFILSQLYMNSLMAALNTRKHFRALIDRTVTDSIYVSETSQLAVE